MKIAHIVSGHETVPPKNKNGLEFLVSYLVDGLVDRGNEVFLFAPKGSETKAKLVPVLDMPTMSYKELSPWRGMLAQMNLSACLQNAGNFDIIHSHIGEYAHIFSKLIKVPIIETLHSPVDRTFEYMDKAEIFKNLVEYFRIQGDCLHRVCVSSNQRSLLKNKDKTYVIHNAIPVKDFIFNDKPDNYFAYLGYLNEEKGADEAIKIAKDLEISLCLAGNATNEFYNKNLRNSVSEKIKFLGPIGYESKINFLSHAQALLMPLKWEEPFGLVIVEALACGTPVIGYRKGALPEIVNHGKTGFVVDTRDEFKEAIKNIDLIDRKQCRRQAVRSFNVDRMVSEYENLYFKIIEDQKY